MTIIYETPESCAVCPATNILEDGETDEPWPNINYWHGPWNPPKNAEIIMKLKCPTIISKIAIRNGHNAHHRGSGTKKFSIYMAPYEAGPWEKVLTGNLEDPRQLDPVPKVYFDMIGKGMYIKFQTEEYYGIGAALQYFDARSNYFQKEYKASNALEPAICDNYAFSHNWGDFRWLWFFIFFCLTVSIKT